MEDVKLLKIHELALEMKAPVSKIWEAVKMGFVEKSTHESSGLPLFEWPKSRDGYEKYREEKEKDRTHAFILEMQQNEMNRNAFQNEKKEHKSVKQEQDKKELEQKKQNENDDPIRNYTLIEKKGKAEKIEAEALLARIEVEKKALLLVDAESFEDLFSAMVADARDRLLSIKSAIKNEFPDADVKILEFVHEYVKGSMCSLAIPERKTLPVDNRLEFEDE